jgi:hypothetical protein
MTDDIMAVRGCLAAAMTHSPTQPMSTLTRITIPGYPEITSAVREVVRASLDQRRPSKRLAMATNAVLDALGHELSTKQVRKGRAAA